MQCDSQQPMDRVVGEKGADVTSLIGIRKLWRCRSLLSTHTPFPRHAGARLEDTRSMLWKPPFVYYG